MRNRYRRFRRSGVFYAEDSVTGEQKSLRTRSSREADQLLQSKNQAAHSPLLNRELGRIFLSASDPTLVQRTWAAVMAEFESHGRPSTRVRYERAMRDPALDSIRHRAIADGIEVANGIDFDEILAASKQAVKNHCPLYEAAFAFNGGYARADILSPVACDLWDLIEVKVMASCSTR